MNAEEADGVAAEPEQGPEAQEAALPSMEAAAAQEPEGAQAGGSTAPAPPEGLAVTVDVERLPASQAALRIQVDAREVDKAYRQVYRDLSRSGRIRGFRPGKAPRDIIRLQVGADAVKEYVINELRPQALEQALRQSGVVPLEVTEVGQVEVAEGQPLTFTATLTVRPEPELGAYKGLKLRRPVTDITDEDIQEELDELLQAVTGYEKADRNEVREGDLVVLDMVLVVADGQPQSTPDVEFVVGQGSREPKLDEHLIGAPKGETRTVEVRYSDDFAVEQLAGKPVQVTFTVKAISEKHTPELTDEFVKENYGFDSLTELKEDIKQRLAANARERAEVEVRRQTIEQATQASQVEIPDRLVAAEVEDRERAAALETARAGISYEDFLRLSGRTKEQARQEYAEGAREALARAFVLEAIADAESIQVTAEELEAELARIGERQDQPLEAAVVRRVLEQRGELGLVRSRLRHEKVVDFLLEQAEVQEVGLDDYLAAAGAAHEDSEGEGSASE